jgi:hypothetical protein
MSIYALSVPAIVSMASGLATHHFVTGTTLPLIAAVLAGVLSLMAIAITEIAKTRRIAIREKGETHRAGLPYKAEHTLAGAEARNRERYVKAQTRRFFRLPADENYKPDSATNLTEVMGEARKPSAGDRTLNGSDPKSGSIDNNPHNGRKG